MHINRTGLTTPFSFGTLPTKSVVHCFGMAHQCGTKSVVWSTDGRRLALGLHSEGIAIHDAESGKKLIQTPVLRDSAISLSANGTRLTTSSNSGFKLWDLTENRPLVMLSEQFGPCTVISPNGELVAAIIANEPCVFPVADASARLKLPVRWQTALWSPDSKRLAVVSGAENKVSVLTLDRAETVEIEPAVAGDFRIAWSPDGSSMAIVGSNATLVVRDATDGRLRTTLDTKAVGDWPQIAWGPGGKWLLAYDNGGAIAWAIDGPDAEARTLGQAIGAFQAAAPADDGRSVTLVTKSGEVRCWDPTNQKNEKIGDLATSTGGRLLANASFIAPLGCGAVGLWDIKQCRPLGVCVDLPNNWLFVQPDGQYTGSAGVERELLYVIETDAGQQTLEPHEFEKRFVYRGRLP